MDFVYGYKKAHDLDTNVFCSCFIRPIDFIFINKLDWVFQYHLVAFMNPVQLSRSIVLFAARFINDDLLLKTSVRSSTVAYNNTD